MKEMKENKNNSNNRSKYTNTESSTSETSEERAERYLAACYGLMTSVASATRDFFYLFAQHTMFC